jgi:hypothetical protein
MEHYQDEEGRLRCSDCHLPVHKGSCDMAIRKRFTKQMTKVIVKDGSEITRKPSTGRI